MNKLQEKYNKEIVKSLEEKLGVKNPNAVPVLSKIVLNMGVRDVIADKKNLEKAASILTQISGQKPRVMKAKKSISTFKLREGDEIALMVTLRGKRMYDFFEKLVTIVFPRVRTFMALKEKVLTDAVITHWVFRKVRFFRKLIQVKLIKYKD